MQAKSKRTKAKSKPEQITDWPNRTATKETCLMIQWEGVYTIGDRPVCPRCHEPAEMVLGIMGNPCFAHKY